MTKISQLSDLGANLAAGDEFVVRDVSDASTPNKKVTSSGFIDYVIAQGSVAGFTQISAGATAPASVQCFSSGTTREVIVTTSGVERARFTTAGQLRMAGAGITFNGDTATANELDDYEEGTHTATLTPSTSGSITLNATYQTLTYTKVGRLVSIRGTLIASSSSSPVGYVTVSLPFTPAAVSGIGYAGGSVFVDAATGVNANQFVLMITTGGARIYLGDSTTLQSDSAQAIASAGQIYLEMNYHV